MARMSGMTYRCSAGETFDSVALAVYGDEQYASELMNANPALVRVFPFIGGETLELPVVQARGSETGASAAQAPWKE